MKTNALTVKAEPKQFEKIRLFLKESLEHLRVTEHMIRENELVVEEIFLRIIEQYGDQKPEITISLNKRIGEVKILLDFYGERFDIDFNSVDEFNPGAAILSKYEDKIGLSYRKRHNTIAVIAKRTYDRMGYYCIFAMIMAILVYVAADLFNYLELLHAMLDKLIFPLEMMFGDAMIMIAAPVTFFSLVTNITNCYVVADNRINLKKLGIGVVLSGAIANLIAIGYQYVIRETFGDLISVEGTEYNLGGGSFVDKFINTIYDIVPDDIFTAFSDISPFPLVLIGILTAGALCTTNKHFETIKGVNDAINSLFSRILSIIMMFLPVAAFLAFTDVLLSYGYKGLVFVAMIVMLLLTGVVVMLMYVGASVAVYGINPIRFIKKCIPAIIENFKINSSIDAVPYNTRFCTKIFGISVNKLDVEIPILAQVNQTGNCFMIMFTSLIVMYYTGADMEIGTLCMLAILIIFISLGAPGQEGSLMIGLIIVFSYVGVSFDLMAFIIYIEVFLGRSLPVLNTLFDIATVVRSNKLEKERKQDVSNNI